MGLNTIRNCIVVAVVLLSASAAQAATVEGCGFRVDVNMSLERLATKILYDAYRTLPRHEFRRACDYYMLATLYQFERQNDKAHEYYNKALGWHRVYRDVYEGLGDLYTATGKTKLAADAYSQAQLTSRDSADGQYSRCWDRAVRGYPLDRALADCTAALAHWRNMSGAFYIRGLSELAKGDRATGEIDIAAAKKSWPRIADFYALYGVVLPSNGEGQESSR